jgi:hypothetical protein
MRTPEDRENFAHLDGQTGRVHSFTPAVGVDGRGQVKIALDETDLSWRHPDGHYLSVGLFAYADPCQLEVVL